MVWTGWDLGRSIGRSWNWETGSPRNIDGTGGIAWLGSNRWGNLGSGVEKSWDWINCSSRDEKSCPSGGSCIESGRGRRFGRDFGRNPLLVTASSPRAAFSFAISLIPMEILAPNSLCLSTFAFALVSSAASSYSSVAPGTLFLNWPNLTLLFRRSPPASFLLIFLAWDSLSWRVNCISSSSWRVTRSDARTLRRRSTVSSGGSFEYRCGNPLLLRSIAMTDAICISLSSTVSFSRNSLRCCCSSCLVVHVPVFHYSWVNTHIDIFFISRFAPACGEDVSAWPFKRALSGSLGVSLLQKSGQQVRQSSA